MVGFLIYLVGSWEVYFRDFKFMFQGVVFNFKFLFMFQGVVVKFL